MGIFLFVRYLFQHTYCNILRYTSQWHFRLFFSLFCAFCVPVLSVILIEFVVTCVMCFIYHLLFVSGQWESLFTARTSTKQPHILHIPFTRFLQLQHISSLLAYSSSHTFISSGRLSIYSYTFWKYPSPNSFNRHILHILCSIILFSQ